MNSHVALNLKQLLYRQITAIQYSYGVWGLITFEYYIIYLVYYDGSQACSVLREGDLVALRTEKKSIFFTVIIL